jgi:hypothetical protein
MIKWHKHFIYSDGTLICKEDMETELALSYRPHPTFLFRGKRYYLHKTIWEYHYGAIPKGYDILFADRDICNCRIENLRIENGFELKHVCGLCRNHSGLKGVYKDGNHWMARAVCKGIMRRSAVYRSKFEAAKAHNALLRAVFDTGLLNEW